MQIEILYIVIFAVAITTMILTITRKMSFGIGIIGTVTAFGIAYLIAPYSQIVISPIGNAIWYGGVWDISAILAVAHLASMVYLGIIGIYNLMSSGGKIVWA